MKARLFVTLCAAALLSSVAAPAALAQTAMGMFGTPAASAPRAVLTNGQVVVVSGGAQASSGSSPAGASSSSSKKSRLDRLKKLAYDRRPSAILRAWSEDAPKPPRLTGDEAWSLLTLANGRPPEPAAASTMPTPKIGRPPEPRESNTAQGEDEAKQVQARAKAKLLAHELKLLQRWVTLGRWRKVERYLADLPADEAKPAYSQMLRSLGSPPPSNRPQMSAPGIGSTSEQHVFAMDDLLGLAAACPHKLDRASIASLGAILRRVLDSGTLAADAAARLEREAKKPAGEAPLTKKQCAQLLVAAGQGGRVWPFLPTLEEAVARRDAELLMLLANGFLTEHGRQRKPELLEKAWQALQAILAQTPPEVQEISESAAEQSQPAPSDEADERRRLAQIREQALQRTLALSSRVREELGQAWLEASFTRDPRRGMAVLKTLGARASQGLQNHPRGPTSRARALELQKTAVEALFQAAPERAAEWRDALELLAGVWLREAEFSRVASPANSLRAQMRRDSYGNIYFIQQQMMIQRQQSQQNRPRPIATDQVLEAGPSEAWIALLRPASRSRVRAAYARLYLHGGEEDKAYPYIETLADDHPELARDLAHEFIRVWTRNHDPNASRRQTNPYMFMYGYERKAESIPLTRSKQQRNIAELTAWVARLRALPLKELDESLFVAAFTTCHSTAEVYRLDAIEKVLGPMDQLEPKTMARLVRQMRENLAGLWRMPAEQEKQKTRRKQKDIEAEVLRGYGVANRVVSEALQKHGDHWRLHLAKACLMHDENAFRQEVDPNSQYSERRLESFAEFQKAARLYAQAVPTLREDEQTTDVYDYWFYASLGATNLGQIDHRTTAAPRQPALLRAAILALPGETAEHHMGMFANNLFTRASALKPNVKFRYLNAGFEIVGDHEQAREARKLYDYYKDLVTEIELVARIDGSSNVGHEQPFGVFVELRHTREIERESGGFGRYLTNQNKVSFAYNYGRPLQNYRDKFAETVNARLAEHFEVLSVTFEPEDVHSRTGDEYGWRVTPYAYLLLKPRGPRVDKLPALKMDLDFLDTSGYVVLPIQSPAVPLDATAERRDPRPYSNLRVTQTLDERQAGEGKLILEIKAEARGLVPDLEELLDVAPPGFEVVEIEDQGLGVSRFDPESATPAVISERVWLVTLAGREDLAALPEQFAFPQAKVADAKLEYLRFEDADLASVGPVISLEREYGETEWPWTWLAVLGGVGCLAALLLSRGLLDRSGKEAEPAPRLPERLTPFNVLAMLRDLHAHNGLAPDEKRELEWSIQRLERAYFADDARDKPDLQALAENWLPRAR